MYDVGAELRSDFDVEVGACAVAWKREEKWEAKTLRIASA